MTALQPRCFGFDGFVVDSVARQVTDADGKALPVTAKALDVLLYLLAHRDRVVGKDELLAEVWAGRVVEENNLTQAVSLIRRALGVGAGDHRFVVTVPGRGYRFVADVQPLPEPREARIVAPAAPAAAGSGRGSRTWTRTAGLPLVLLAVLSAIAGGLHLTREGPAPLPASVPTLAVLPFHGIGTPQRDELLELGVAETLISRLAGSSALRVLPLSAVQDYAGTPTDPVHAGARLGADYVVDGSIQHRAGLIRVNARLTSVPDGRAVWAGTFDEAPERIFTLQDALARDMSVVLPGGAAGRQRHSSPCDGADADAYRAYLRGLHLMNRPERSTLPDAIASFREATVRDPECARAWAGIAFSLRAMVMTADGEPNMLFPLAKSVLEQALRIDPRSAEAYASKGFIEFWYDWDWAASEASLRHALALDGELAEAHFALAHLLNNIGRLDEALPHARRATLLDPMSPITNAVVASFFLNDGQVEEGRRRVERVLQTDPGFWVGRLFRARLLSADAARDVMPELALAHEGCGRCSIVEAALAMAYARRGDRAEAERIRQGLLDRRMHAYVPATRVAIVHLALGDREAALDELERALQERDVHLSFLAVDPTWRMLEGHPRFEAVRGGLALPASAWE